MMGTLRILLSFALLFLITTRSVATDYDAEAALALSIVPAPAPTITVPVTPTPTVVTTLGGDHTHTCSKGHTWGGPGHSHNCPVCGEFQNIQDSYRPQASFQSAPFYGYGQNCANGQCGVPTRSAPPKLFPNARWNR